MARSAIWTVFARCPSKWTTKVAGPALGRNPTAQPNARMGCVAGAPGVVSVQPPVSCSPSRTSDDVEGKVPVYRSPPPSNGVAAGETVVTDGQLRLTPKSKVEVKEQT